MKMKLSVIVKDDQAGYDLLSQVITDARPDAWQVHVAALRPEPSLGATALAEGDERE